MKRYPSVISLVAAMSVVPLASDAALSITIQEIGPNVEITASGSVNLAALGAPDVTALYSTFIVPSSADLRVGVDGSGDAYTTVSGPSDFGTGGFAFPNSSTGDYIALTSGSLSQIIVPEGYVSGSPLSSSSTYANTSLASLGIDQGTYLWNWGSGGDADSATLTVVPEPSTFALLLAFAAVGAVALKRRRS